MKEQLKLSAMKNLTASFEAYEVFEALCVLDNLYEAADSSSSWSLSLRRSNAIKTLCSLLLRAFDGQLIETDLRGIARWKKKMGEDRLNLWRE